MKPKVARVGVGIMLYNSERDEVLLGLRNEDKNKASSELGGEGTWTLPGGKVEFGDTLVKTCFKKTKEETDMEIGRVELVSVTDNITDNAHFVTMGFICESWEGEPKVMEPDEITKWEWFHLTCLPKNMYEPSRQLIDKVANGDEIYEQV